MIALLQKPIRFALSGFLALMLLGCKEETPDELLTSAKSYLHKNDRSSASVQLRNALQKAPTLPEARYLLGSILLDNGDPIAAERELRKALEYGYAGSAAYVALARAMFEQKQFAKVMQRRVLPSIGELHDRETETTSHRRG